MNTKQVLIIAAVAFACVIAIDFILPLKATEENGVINIKRL